MTPEDYEKMNDPERAEWIKSEVVKSIVAGKDIFDPIYIGILNERRLRTPLQAKA